MSFLSKIYRAGQEAYWNACDNYPEMMGLDPETAPKKETQKPQAEPAPEPVSPSPVSQPTPPLTPVYVMMPQSNPSYPTQALIPQGYRLISEEDYRTLKKYRAMYLKSRRQESEAER